VDASRKGRHVLAAVPNAVLYNNATTNDTRKTPLQAHISNGEKGEGFAIGSASVISVFTIFLTAIAVKPATQSDANHPPAAVIRKHFYHYYYYLLQLQNTT
jgi:hypothetical protein